MPDVGEGFFQHSSSHWLVAPQRADGSLGENVDEHEITNLC